VDILQYYVHNTIEYDYAYVAKAATERDEQLSDAQNVLDNGRGICYQFTKVFVSMCKSIGIPARERRGITFDKRHSWAEVYINNEWVIYDPTSPETLPEAHFPDSVAY
jgi:transglutaminase-like putative cysteine protease